MLRVVFLLLLVVLCYGAVQYDLKVDPVGGQDVIGCVSAPVQFNTISPNISCKSIGYALGHVSQTDTLTLTLASGTYSGANNTNQVFNLQQYDIVGPASGPKAIIDCGSSVSGFQLNPKVTLVIYSISNVEFHNCMGSAIIVLSGSGSVEVTSCVFVNNRAISNGGAIYSKSYSLTVASSIFSNNSATGLGGAIYAELQELSVSSSTFYMNSASSGAGIYGLNIGTPGNTMYFLRNNFTNNTAGVKGGAFFADNSDSGARTYDFTLSKFDNNCATSPYTNSYDIQVRCAGDCKIGNQGNYTGCTDIETNIPPPPAGGGHKSNKDRAIIIGVVVPFGILAILSIVLFMYIRKRHNAEMAKRDDYRKKILLALENMPPEEQEAARLEAENADPTSPKCQLCQQRPISSPLPCGHEIVCSVCRTILLECPVKGCKQPTR